jgi:hypothetical protein
MVTNFFNKKNLIYKIILIIIFSISILIYFNYLNRNFEEKSLFFYNTEINGVLTEYSRDASGTHIIIDSQTEYLFLEIPAENLKYKVKIGDSIIKHAYNDFFLVKKPTGELLRFTFELPKK